MRTHIHPVFIPHPSILYSPSTNSKQNNHGGGFCDDLDRVSMIVRKFASPHSAGCSSQDSFFLKRKFQSFKRDSFDVSTLGDALEKEDVASKVLVVG